MGTASGKCVIVSAPSGAGKTTIVRRLMDALPQLEFSVSATSRPRRDDEVEGRDYHFITSEEFKRRTQEGDFMEWEEVYPGRYYGTLRAEIDAIWERGRSPIFDVDVVGGLRLKEIFGVRALALFIAPPSIEALKERLRARGTESPDALQVRFEKAEREMSYAPRFDAVVLNDDLDRAVKQAVGLVRRSLEL
jgi:guanylate kinase